jgi:hypothetical protein
MPHAGMAAAPRRADPTRSRRYRIEAEAVARSAAVPTIALDETRQCVPARRATFALHGKQQRRERRAGAS